MCDQKWTFHIQQTKLQLQKLLQDLWQPPFPMTLQDPIGKRHEHSKQIF